MVSYRIKDNRQWNLPPKLEVTNEDNVIVRFNEPWIEMVRVKYSRTMIIKRNYLITFFYYSLITKCS
jgi:hypothetical protein